MCEVLEEKERNPKGHHRANSVPSVISYYNYVGKIGESIQSGRLQGTKFTWLDSAYFCCPWDFLKMTPDRPYHSHSVKIQRYSASFRIRMTKYSPETIRVELHREFKDYHDTDETYFLRIFFEIEDSLCPGKFTDMPYFLNEVSEDFSSHCRSREADGSTIVKCGIWMYEIAPLENKVSAAAEHCLHVSMQEHQLSIPKIYDDMAYLIGCNEMSGLFSGRHGEDFVKEKLLLLTRTLLYSNALAGRKTCAENNMPFEKTTPIDIILGYIYDGIAHCIEKEECLHLFKMSFVYGLPYLQDECAGFMARNLADDYDFLIDVIVTTNTLERWDILDTGLDYFLKYKKKVLECDRWKSLEPLQVRLIQTHMERITFFMM